jgi:hypothetical protein
MDLSPHDPHPGGNLVAVNRLSSCAGGAWLSLALMASTSA